jgi:hypothetical protein
LGFVGRQINLRLLLLRLGFSRLLIVIEKPFVLLSSLNCHSGMIRVLFNLPIGRNLTEFDGFFFHHCVFCTAVAF